MMSASSPSPWRDTRILFTLLLVFLSGSAAGALGMRYARQQPVQKPAPYWKEAGKEVSLQKFKKELNLSSQQAGEMETILDDFMMYYQTLQAQMDEVRASGKDRILKILDAEQREKFLRMMSELQARQIK